jgi:hypothetical protein
MDWIFQTTGIINHYKPELHYGSQPIRVLNSMNLFMFQNTHPDFISELTEAFSKHGFSKRVNVVYSEGPIQRTPYIIAESKEICLDETFLSYLWCICHSVYTIYVQTIDFPRVNAFVGYQKYIISQDKISKAYDLFDYAKLLIRHFDKWDINTMPNPERYFAEDRDYVEQPNMFYTEAMKFILCHEYTHAIKHIDKINSGRVDLSSYVEFEEEADYNAIELMKKGIYPTGRNALTIHIGITIGILSMFFFKPTTVGTKHPNTEDRLATALEQLNLDEESPCWGIALIGLQLWSDQFELKLQWNNHLTDKQAFYEILRQIKEVANNK